MVRSKHAPGRVRDAIISYLEMKTGDASPAEITRAVAADIGEVSSSSVRSYLRLRPDTFVRTAYGRYQLNRNDGHHVTAVAERTRAARKPVLVHGKAVLYRDDCFDWLDGRPENTIHAVVTDPPFGLVEYTEEEQRKLRNGKGGVWRIPPSFDSHRRAPLPRFTTLSKADLRRIHEFFRRFGTGVSRVLVPGAHVFVASNPLVSYVVASALVESGLEPRGTITRLVMTMRGGDRPKNAHEEFCDVSVMPRSMAEPWLLFRNPLEGRVQDNLRKWGTGGLRRVSERQPFGDVIKSHPTRAAEKRLAPHPSLKPQAFLRQVVRAALPLQEGVVLDPFAGSGSTLAAANRVGYSSIGVEHARRYVELATKAIPVLEALQCSDSPNSPRSSKRQICPEQRTTSGSRSEHDGQLECS
ncbi:MAG: DNA methyltransferase [Gemmatimonadetes bacterium]|nr:DNA methyltransferase [Gemmatimonadota bacterium]